VSPCLPQAAACRRALLDAVKMGVKAADEGRMQKETDAALRRTNLEHLLAIPDRFWGVSRGVPDR
jgi:hypothetical protein